MRSVCLALLACATPTLSLRVAGRLRGLKPSWGPGAALEKHHLSKHLHHQLAHHAMPIHGTGKGNRVEFFSKRGCKGESVVVDEASLHGSPYAMCRQKFKSGLGVKQGVAKGSMRVYGTSDVDLFMDCSGSTYWASVIALDGCTNIYSWPSLESVKFVTGIINKPQTTKIVKKPTGSKTGGVGKYNVIFSCESSNYFGYQIQANYFGFLQTKQTGATWTRLMTSRGPDDLMKTFPTYYAKRHPYAWRYGPFNKADVLTKWFASPDKPKEDVIVCIDPDNWLTKDLRPIVDKVKPGLAYAEKAFFYGSRMTVNRLWKKFCRKNCDVEPDRAAVPYFVHRDDMAKIAPVWKEYILLIKGMADPDGGTEPNLGKQFSGIQFDWCAEMFGYIFAAAEVGVKHNLEHKLQVRDVEGRPRGIKWLKSGIPDPTTSPYMIHMGRAFFPQRGYPAGKPWWMTGATDFHSWTGYGAQVWCKCNDTASDIIPWPLPKYEQWNDFQSRITLYYLHASRQMFGPIPKNPKVRGDNYYRGMS